MSGDDSGEEPSLALVGTEVGNHLDGSLVDVGEEEERSG